MPRPIERRRIDREAKVREKTEKYKKQFKREFDAERNHDGIAIEMTLEYFLEPTNYETKFPDGKVLKSSREGTKMRIESLISLYEQKYTGRISPEQATVIRELRKAVEEDNDARLNDLLHRLTFLLKLNKE